MMAFLSTTPIVFYGSFSPFCFNGVSHLFHRVIIDGEQKTGVTTFFINHKIDTGKIILQEEVPIHATNDVGTLHNRLIKKGVRSVCEMVIAIATGQYVVKAQYVLPKTTTAPKLSKNTC